MAKREFRKDTKGVKRMAAGDYVGTLPQPANPFGISPLPAPDPNSVNPGFGSPGSLPNAGGGRSIGPDPSARMPASAQDQNQLQALLKKYGPYASIGMIAGGIGGNAGIAAAPVIALLMQKLLKKGGKGQDNSMVIKNAKGGAIGGEIPKSPNQKEIKKMRREFRSNGPKVRNLPVSPRKAMDMGMISPTAIPTLKRGGMVEKEEHCLKCGGMAHGGACMKKGGKVEHKVVDKDHDDMKRGGHIKKYAGGGEIRGWGMARGKGPSHVE